VLPVAFNRAVEALLLPPGSSIALLVLALLLWRHRKTAFGLAGIGVALLYAASIPAVSDPLLRSLEQRHPPLGPAAVDAANAGAIVVLGGGRDLGAPEYGADSPSAVSLQRLRYGVWLQRRRALPLVVSGGAPFSGTGSEAAVLHRVARDEFGAKPVWSEDRSRTTAENARNSAALLQRRGIRRVLLVTDSLHMRRAVGAFQAAGLQVVAAPTGFHTPGYMDRSWRAWLPAAAALKRSKRALHEYLGMAWYWMNGLRTEVLSTGY